jgi:putative phosphoesterase
LRAPAAPGSEAGVRVVVMADTHIRSTAGHAPRLPDAMYPELRRADVILHAGDVVSAGLLTELETFAPVVAVLGNNDHELVDRLPETVEMELGGVPVAMVHDSGARDGRDARLQRRFPDARLVVFGHSHLPEDRIGGGRQRLFNPGSPTQRRRAPERTYGIVTLASGRIATHRVVAIREE